MGNTCSASLSPREELVIACRWGQGARVRKLLKRQSYLVHLDSTTNGQEGPFASSCFERLTPLLVACLFASTSGHLAVVNVLLAHGANVHCAIPNGETALHCAAKCDDPAILIRLLESQANVHAVTSSGETPLHIAARHDHVAVANALLENHASVDATNDDGHTPLYFATLRGSAAMVIALIAHGADVDGATPDHGTLLHVAAQFGHVEVATALLDHGTGVDAPTEQGETALYVAARAGKEDVARLLLTRGANVDIATAEGATPLYIAAQNGCEAVVRHLLEHNARVDAATVNRATPLYVSARNGHHNVVAELLEHQANVQSATADGATPLYTAARYGHSEVVVLLLEYEAKIDAVTNDGMTPLHAAAERGHDGAISLLVNHGADLHCVAKNGETPLCVAARQGRGSTTRVCIALGASVNVKARDGMTPLHVAVRDDRAEVVAALMAHGADVNAASSDDSTPLIVAARAGHLSIAATLLRHSADVNASTRDGTTALHTAAREGHQHVASMLIIENAEVDVADAAGQTALLMACQHEHSDVVRVLLAYGADVEAASVDGWTPLLAAVKNGCADAVVRLLERNANADVTTASGDSPLHVAAEHGHLEVLNKLLQHTSSVDATNRSGETALFLAAQHGHRDVAMALLHQRAKVDTARLDGATPLFAAAAHGHDSVLHWLLSFRASLNVATAVTRTTPLCVAAKNGHKDIVLQLLEMLFRLPPTHRHSRWGLDDKQYCGQLEAADIDGNTPLLAAARFGHFDVVRKLMSAGASVTSAANDGETLLVAVARWREPSLLSTLFEQGHLTPSEDRATLLLATLHALHDCAPRTFEFCAVWLRVVARLTRFHDHLAQTRDTAGDVVYQFVMIVVHVIRLKPLCTAASVVARLVASQTVVARVRDVHIELTLLEHSIASPDKGDDTWMSKCLDDERALLTGLQETIEDPTTPLEASLETPDQRDDAVLLLQHKLRDHSMKCSPDLADLLAVALHRVMAISNTGVPTVPAWFISPHELVVEEAHESSSGVAVAQAKWSHSVVTVSLHPIARSAFVATMDECRHLSHPNIVKLFGASHLHAPPLAVFENASSTDLRSHLARDANKRSVWQRLLEVAHGLSYLINRGVVLKQLWCDDIWVDANDVAKVNAVVCLVPRTAPPHPDHFRAMCAPELGQGAAPSAASMVFALGLCIVEALTGSVRWRTLRRSARSTSSRDGYSCSAEVRRGYLPEVPEGISAAQVRLLEEMWSADPTKRPTIASAVLQMKQLADDERASGALASAASSSQVRSGGPTSTSLKHHVFIEFNATIAVFLERLQAKSSFFCREHEDAVAHILERLRDIYSVLLTQRRRPRDIAVTTYCDVLVRLHSFIGDAVHEKSILERAKSQKASLQSNTFHRRLDELLELLAPSTVDSVHSWTAVCNATSERAAIEPSNTSHAAMRIETLDKRASARAANEAVQIVRFDSGRLDEQFKAIDMATIEAAVAVPRSNEAPQLRWFIESHELVYDRAAQIGVGAFGEVFRASWRGTPVVVKFMGYEADGGAYRRDLFFHELRVWFPLRHPHVIRLFGACHVGKRFFVCEFAGNGTLREYLKRNGGALEQQRWRLLHQVALGLQYMHAQNIVHNDLKCDNVLIDSGGSAKLTDFGLSCIPNSAEVKIDPKKQGAQQWKSPECLRGDRLTAASDVYAFGMCVLEAVTGDAPWGSRTIDAVVRFRVKNKQLPPQPASMHAGHWSLVQLMCRPIPTERVQIAHVIETLREFAQEEHQGDASVPLAKAVARAEQPDSAALGA